jgi:hypothetical protein
MLTRIGARAVALALLATMAIIPPAMVLAPAPQAAPAPAQHAGQHHPGAGGFVVPGQPRSVYGSVRYDF